MAYLSWSSKWETRMTPAPAPVHMRELSKYMVQYSWRVGGGGVYVSIHSAMKLDKICDLIAILGT
jgi:hypothetical protein